MPTIEERFQIHASYSPMLRGHLIAIRLDYELYLVDYLYTDYDCQRNMMGPMRWAAEWVREYVLKEWPTCDQTSTSELQYRKTITCCCGRLKVRESLS